MKIKEIFDSIQGEGYHAGSWMTFIRLSGCDINCPLCDTDYAGGEDMSVAEIVANVATRMVWITGGEPTIHKDLGILIAELRKIGKYVCLATAGEREIPYKVDWVSVSPHRSGKLRCGKADETKLTNLITDNDISNIYRELPLYARNRIYIQPRADMSDLDQCLDYVKKGWGKLSIQINKVIGKP